MPARHSLPRMRPRAVMMANLSAEPYLRAGTTPDGMGHTKPEVKDGVLHCRHCHREWPCEPNIIAARMVAAVLGIEINTR